MGKIVELVAVSICIYIRKEILVGEGEGGRAQGRDEGARVGERVDGDNAYDEAEEEGWAMPISEQTFKRIALEDPEGKWELHCGRLRSKPGMTYWHNRCGWLLGVQLHAQLDPEQFEVRVDSGRARRPASTYYIPDVMVIPCALTQRWHEHPYALEAYSEPLPLVVEVWSPSTGEYDVDEKLPEYQRRGDLEIWRIHPYERSLTAWRRQPDGRYSESSYDGGVVEPIALAGVSIDLDTLFSS
ncbi:MAG: Uma2 family endonuclease [Dehalococcoidia bacterium]